MESRPALRNQNLELGKFLASCGVVLIHLSPNTPNAESLTDALRLFPVFFFYATSVWFVVRRASTSPTELPKAIRFERILIPYATWTILYWVLRSLKNGGGVNADWLGVVFFGQAAVHLYFLPELLCHQVFAVAIVQLIGGREHKHLRRRAVLWLIGAVGFEWAGSKCGAFGWENAILSSVTYTLCALLMLGYSKIHAAPSRLHIWVASTALVAALVFHNGIETFSSATNFLLGPIVGLLCLFILSSVNAPSFGRAFTTVVSCYFGIYLSHHAIEETFEFACARAGLDLFPYTVFSRIGVAVLTVGLGVIVTLLLRLHRIAAFLFLGETQPLNQDQSAAK